MQLRLEHFPHRKDRLNNILSSLLITGVFWSKLRTLTGEHRGHWSTGSSAVTSNMFHWSAVSSLNVDEGVSIAYTNHQCWYRTMTCHLKHTFYLLIKNVCVFFYQSWYWMTEFCRASAVLTVVIGNAVAVRPSFAWFNFNKRRPTISQFSPNWWKSNRPITAMITVAN